MTAPIRPGAPVLRTVIAMQLVVQGRVAVPPQRTVQYGGLEKAPAGSIVRLDIGQAEDFFDWDANYIVDALVDAAEIEVIGSSPRGVEAVRRELSRAISRARRRRAG